MKTYTAPVFVKHIACPSCGELTKADHIEAGREMTWWCGNEDCGKQYRWKELPDGRIESEPTGVVVDRVAVLLEGPDKMLLIVNHGRHSKDGVVTAPVSMYFFEEHTCPINLLRAAEIVVAPDGDSDKHGLFMPLGWMPLSDFARQKDATDALKMEGWRLMEESV